MQNREEEKSRLLKILLILIWVLALIHMSAEYYYLYWTLRWFDIVTHFLGGLWLGIAGVWVWFYSGYFSKKKFSYKSVFFVALTAGLSIGFVWEIFELLVWEWSGEGLPINYAGDTTLDLIVDTAGAVTAFVLLRELFFTKASFAKG